MRKNIIVTILVSFLLSLTMQSCVKDLKKEGIFITTHYHGVLQDMRTLQPLQNIKIVSTNGARVHETIYSDNDGAFSIDLSVQQIKDGYFIAIQPDSLYKSQNLYLDHIAPGLETYDFGIIKIKGPSTPILTTRNATNITTNSALLHGNIIEDGNSAIIECGFVYDIIQYPTIENHKAVVANNNGTLETTLQLSPNTTYYVRSYARNSIGIGYGEQIAFKTLDGLPTVGSTAITNIKSTQATCTGSFISDGGFPITDRGICWSITPNPTIDNLHRNLGTGIGDFETQITNLQPNTQYYLRAYARNSSGIAYGETSSFTTLNGMPTVTTTTVTEITSQSAVSGGNVLNDGDFPILQRGICFSTSPLPTLSDNHTYDGAGTGQFVSHLSNLTSGTTYYYRAYATNVIGTSYGEQFIFVTH